MQPVLFLMIKKGFSPQYIFCGTQSMLTDVHTTINILDQSAEVRKNIYACMYNAEMWCGSWDFIIWYGIAIYM